MCQYCAYITQIINAGHLVRDVVEYSTSCMPICVCCFNDGASIASDGQP